MSGVNITISGDFFAPIEEIQKRVKDLRQPLSEFGEYLKTVTREDRFDREQSPEGVKWKELKPGYAEYKANTVGAQRKILVFHGNLRDTIEYQLSGKQKLLFGSVLQYAEHQQEVRPFIGVNDEDEAELKEIITDFLVK